MGSPCLPNAMTWKGRYHLLLISSTIFAFGAIQVENKLIHLFF